MGGAVAQDSQDEVWDLAGRYGVELWRRQKGRFVELQLGERTFALEPPAADLDEVATRPGTCSCGGPWPVAFAYCPDCGAALADAPAETDAHLWQAPFGETTGVPTVRLAARPDAAGKEEFAVPDPGALALVVGGTPRRLYATDQRSGRLYLWSETRHAWREVLKTEPWTNLPRWSWSAIARDDALIFPTNAGPCAVTAAVAVKRQVYGLEDWAATDVCLGGTALVAGTPVIPVFTAGQLHIACYQNSQWRLEPVANAAAVTSEAPFACPVSSADEAFWAGRAGYLCVRLAGNGLSASVQAWPEGFDAVLGLRPMRGTDGTFFQPGLAGPDQTAMESMVPPGVVRQSHSLYGYYLSSGEAVFKDGRRWRLPWGEPTGEYNLEDEFLVPLLAFKGTAVLLAAWPERRHLRAAFALEPGGPTRKCQIQFSARSKSQTRLGVAPTISRLWDLQPVIFGNHLYLYSVPENKCWRWPLEASS